jgi:hypothetical protein
MYLCTQSAQPPKTVLLDMTTTDPCGLHYIYVHQGKPNVIPFYIPAIVKKTERKI